MNISEKAEEYASKMANCASFKERIIRSIAKPYIEKAFENGYEVGFADGLKEKEKYQAGFLEGVVYVDLGLPSGTKWAANYLRDKEGNTIYLSFDDASKLCIPTFEQILEINKYCRIEQHTFGVQGIVTSYSIICMNGKRLNYSSDFLYKGEHGQPLSRAQFWVINNKDDSSKRFRSSVIIGNNFNIINASMGFRFPVILVS